MSEAVSRLAELEDPAEVPEAVVAAARRCTGAPHGQLVLGKGRRARLAIGQDEGGPITAGFPREVVAACEERQTVLCWTTPPGETCAGLHAMLAAPLCTRAHWLGTLVLAHTDPRRNFDQGELERVQILADICAVALDDARILIAQVRERLRLEEERTVLEEASRQLAERLAQDQRDIEALRTVPAPAYGVERLVGASPAMQRLRKEIARYAPTPIPIIFQGEVGSGRDLAARVCHRVGPRGSGPLVIVPCGAIPEDLAQAELFGYVAGAFSGAQADRRGWLAQADGGSIYLDGLEHLAPGVQAMLLRVVQEGRIHPLGADQPVAVNLRFLASTAVDLTARVAQGQWREDLYHRLAGACIQLCPLRERKEDIPELARSILLRGADGQASIEDAALRLLEAYDWPGNVRELANEIRLAVLASGGQVTRSHIAPRIAGLGLRGSASMDEPVGELRVLLRAHIARTLEYTGQNRSEAARLLRISRNTLVRQMRIL